MIKSIFSRGRPEFSPLDRPLSHEESAKYLSDVLPRVKLDGNLAKRLDKITHSKAPLSLSIMRFACGMPGEEARITSQIEHISPKDEEGMFKCFIELACHKPELATGMLLKLSEHSSQRMRIKILKVFVLSEKLGSISDLNELATQTFLKMPLNPSPSLYMELADILKLKLQNSQCAAKQNRLCTFFLSWKKSL